MVNIFRQKAPNFDRKKLRNASWVSCVKRVGKTSQNATKFIGIGNLKNIFAQIGIEFKEKYIYTYIHNKREWKQNDRHLIYSFQNRYSYNTTSFDSAIRILMGIAIWTVVSLRVHT